MFFNTCILSIKIDHVRKLMENVEDSRDGKEKEVKTKGAREISLRACVAKAAGWTLEKANATTSQEASINKAQRFKMMWVFLNMKVICQASPSSMEYMWFSKPSPGLGRLRVVGLASHHPLHMVRFLVLQLRQRILAILFFSLIYCRMKIILSVPHHVSLLELSHIHPNKYCHCHTHLAIEHCKY